MSHRFWDCHWRNGSSDFWQDGGSWDPAIPAEARSDIPTWLALQHLSDPTTIEVRTEYDAAGRPVQVDYPQGMRIRSTYNAAGLLHTVEADRGTGSGWEAVVSSCAYNARGQLVHQDFGNGTLTQREYDPDIERLVRIFTEHSGQGLGLQDLRYTYDPVGNPLEIEDALTNPTYSANQPIPNTRGFHTDARYRLVRATGRKLKSVGRKDLNPYAPAPSEQDYEPYDYRYRYDEVGNFTKNHEYSGGQLHYKDGRLDLFNGDGKEAIDGAAEAGNWTYDANGNATHTPRHQELVYTHDNQARYVNMGGGTEVRYVRHGDQRVLRFVRKNGVKALGVYLGPWEYHERMGVNARAKVVLHLEGHGRHAQGEVVLDGADPESLPWFFVHGDHLGSGHILTKSDGSFVSQEEYFPYGRASDRRDARNRYRFIGVEQDEETGLCMTGPRTYDPVSGRFLQGDPKVSASIRVSPYLYSQARTQVFHDRSGREPVRSEAASPQDLMLFLSESGVQSSSDWQQLWEGDPSQLTSQQIQTRAQTRYLYSEQVGWIDTRHFATAASMSEAGVPPGAVTFAGGMLEVAQGMSPLRGHRTSAFSYEDLQSNFQGAHFGASASAGQGYLPSLEAYFDRTGFTDPAGAPNWSNMPERDRTPELDATRQAGGYPSTMDFRTDNPWFAPAWGDHTGPRADDFTGQAKVFVDNQWIGPDAPTRPPLPEDAWIPANSP